MKAKSLFLALSIIAASAGLAAAQVTIEVKPGVQKHPANLTAEQDDNEIVRQVFSPITDQLNLTAEQRAVVADQFRLRSAEGSLGSISN